MTDEIPTHLRPDAEYAPEDGDMPDYLRNEDGTPLLFKPTEIATWVHEQITEMLNLTASETRNQLHERLFKISQMSGLLATRPTDLGAHVNCTLRVTTQTIETYPNCAVDRTKADTLLMPNSMDWDSQKVKVTDVWCVDHERQLAADRIHLLDVEWA